MRAEQMHLIYISAAQCSALPDSRVATIQLMPVTITNIINGQHLHRHDMHDCIVTKAGAGGGRGKCN